MAADRRTALVTGATSGIGRKIATALASGGVRMGLVSRSSERLRQVVEETGAEDARTYTGDLRDEGSIQRVVGEATADLGRIDILINAAGVWHDENGKFQGPLLHETPTRQIDDVLGVGVRALFSVTRLVLPGMIARRSGKILQIACGFAGPHEAVGWLHYYVANKAIEAFTRGLAAEVRPFEIQANCIAPWFVASDPVRKFYPKESQTALTTGDVARIAVFLTSQESDHVSGQVIELRSKLDHGAIP